MLRINKNTKPVYTYRDIMELEFQQLWEGAQKYMEHLTQVQTKVVEMLPKNKSLLPDEFVELHGKEAQLNLLGLCHEGLWQEAINDSLPEGVSIGTLLDSDEIIRIY